MKFKAECWAKGEPEQRKAELAGEETSCLPCPLLLSFLLSLLLPPIAASLVPNFDVTVLCFGYTAKPWRESPHDRANCLLEGKVSELEQDFTTGYLFFFFKELDKR